MSIIFFLWFWTMELLAISVVSITVGLLFGGLLNKDNTPQPQPQPEEETEQ